MLTCASAADSMNYAADFRQFESQSVGQTKQFLYFLALKKLLTKHIFKDLSNNLGYEDSIESENIFQTYSKVNASDTIDDDKDICVGQLGETVV